MEEYVNDFAKMALALASAQLAKETAIKELGKTLKRILWDGMKKT
jgi:hypothetical protein